MATVAWLGLQPISPGLIELRPAPSTVVVDRHGVVLYETLADDGTRHTTLTADDLPPALVAATIAAEDRRFWWHPGVDPLAVARAFSHDLFHRRVVEGGSTITQQVAKLLLLREGVGSHSPNHDSVTQKRDPAHETRPRRRGITAKLREAVLAIRLERGFSKREILAMYLNLAPYGNQIVGVERASRAYFDRPASMLTPAQAALLAAMPQQPSRFNPRANLRPALARQRAILRRMQGAGSLSAQDARLALGEHLVFAPNRMPFLAPHFVEMVLAESGDAPPRIETTLDAELQADVQNIIRAHRDALRSHGADNVAVVVLDNERGEWLAWEGSGDYSDSLHGGAINGPLALRQPGSALKPLTYALAFEEGYTPASVLPDIPAHFPTAQPGVLYTPRNYDGAYRGPLLARRALAGSENVPAVALASQLGVPSLLRFYKRAGLSSFDKTASYYGLGITLGNAEVRLAELVAAYSTLARGGVWMRPKAVTGDTGQEQRQIVSPRTAFWVTDILSDPDARSYIFGRGGSLEFPFPVAAKTGTSQGYHDNWTIGYTRAVTVGVWVGNFDRTALRYSSGVTGAAPIFHAVMLAAVRRLAGAGAIYADTPLAVPAERMERVEICALSGMRASPSCPSRIHEWLPAGEDLLPCSWHHDSDEGLLVVWPPEYRQWALQNGLLQDIRGRVVKRAAAAQVRHVAAAPARVPRAQKALDIVNPPDGAIYSIDPTLRAEFQALPLRAVASQPGSIQWRVDGVEVGAASSDGPLMWPLVPGSHSIVAQDERGQTARVSIVVR